MYKAVRRLRDKIELQSSWYPSTYTKGSLRIRWSISNRCWQLIHKPSGQTLRTADNPEELTRE